MAVETVKMNTKLWRPLARIVFRDGQAVPWAGRLKAVTICRRVGDASNMAPTGELLGHSDYHSSTVRFDSVTDRMLYHPSFSICNPSWMD
jgi:hypothetical protein